MHGRGKGCWCALGKPTHCPCSLQAVAEREQRSSPSCMAQPSWDAPEPVGFPLNLALAVLVFAFPSQQQFPRPTHPPLCFPLLPAYSLPPWQGEVTSLLDLWLPFLNGRELWTGLVRESEYPPHRRSQTYKKRLNSPECQRWISSE